MMVLDLRIRDLRKERNLTVAELASRIGVSTPHLSGVERGIKNINNHLVERLSAALNVEPYVLFASEEVSEIGGAFSSLSREERARVRNFIQALEMSRTEDKI